ncbi:hypothetical protein ACFE04_002590 [Oxalis oulophora]
MLIIRLIIIIHLFLLLISSLKPIAQAKSSSSCKKSCQLGAVASYYVTPGTNLTYISKIFSQDISEILSYNPQIPNQDSIRSDSRIQIPFSCACLNGEFLGHIIPYTTQHGDTYDVIAKIAFANLTNADWISRFNIVYDQANQIPENVVINVTVNCSCGDGRVSKDYGLFATYPLRQGESLASIAAGNGVADDLIEKYNPGSNFSAGSGLIYVPAKELYHRDSNFSTGAVSDFIPSPGVESKRNVSAIEDKCQLFSSCSTGISSGVIAGISVGGVAGSALLALGVYAGFYRRKKIVEGSLISETEHHYFQTRHVLGSNKGTPSKSIALSPGFTGITMDKSVEFPFEELARATDDFNVANKIGQGGFGVVYYAELRGEKAAIKKMDMQASKEFLIELKVLTHVHHLNLVRLIGYCVEASLFLVYEYIENGNLSQHLRNSAREPLSWSARVQIALDSARGLEYIHEHTVPVYIHRDIKSANILIDNKFRAKVADFGLTKLTEYADVSLHTRCVGTFGYMPPEYAQYGDVSPKIDVYAFGVVLYELISAMPAIIKTNEIVTESTGLVGLFEDVLSRPDPRKDLKKYVDPRLREDYPLDAIFKMAQLAKACTHDNPQLRPTMRSIVVALMTLSSATEDWDVEYIILRESSSSESSIGAVISP